ncbi:3-hydroxybutyrate dehydrogenase [Zhengella mangrovi]|uniref:3-hydroxybutyrate dehydrogenase n=1 Tax=Zhengella mangrovi TaxID=1982044 RepID=A0A2G1QKV1_9HYPH|nr:3-hydroxybutyrate dehydrogenase [Zhengella mangrovi]PHP66157.1 3-hydroxybutyrate dehydrogenase [Zhengella mangrovi]
MSTPRTAVITGSTSGIGMGVAHALAANGCNIVINSFSDSAADHAVAADMAREHGVKAIYIQADMSKPDQCRALVSKAANEFGTVDILVNNAGIQYVAKIEEFPPEKWDAILAINLSSSFHTIAAAVPLMKAAGWGRIVNIASAHGLTASPYKSAYVSAKHGLVGLTKTVALEMAEARVAVTCNAICPGYVKTPLVEGQIEDQMKAHGMSRDEVIEKVILERQPTKEFATVEEIGGTAVFLCSDAAAQITGTTISVDGGWTAL